VKYYYDFGLESTSLSNCTF